MISLNNNIALSLAGQVRIATVLKQTVGIWPEQIGPNNRNEHRRLGGPEIGMIVGERRPQVERLRINIQFTPPSGRHRGYKRAEFADCQLQV